jgi:TRAP-type C4-dicarboxylate transport system permease large subunit
MAPTHLRWPVVLSIGAAVVTIAMKGTAYAVTGSVGLFSDALESGVNLFAACSVAQISLDRITRSLAPFVLVILACLIVITYVPSVSLVLRDLVYEAPGASKAGR